MNAAQTFLAAAQVKYVGGVVPMQTKHWGKLAKKWNLPQNVNWARTVVFADGSTVILEPHLGRSVTVK